jgi:peptide/nickel transport system permease protein
MTGYIVRRIGLAAVTVLLVLLFAFSIIRLIPGDVVQLMVAEQGYAADVEALRRQLGLADPIHVQFSRWMGNALQGDFGQSLWTKRSVVEELKRRLPISAELGAYAIIFGLAIGLPVGTLAAIRQDSWMDYLARSSAIALLSVPGFWMATLILVFPLKWFGWTPPLRYYSWTDDPWQHFTFFLLPAAILGYALAGGIMRLTRTMMLEVLRQDYIRTAWSKGLRERVVVVRHGLRNALIPVVTLLGLQFGFVISGTVITESIFNVPGVGRYFFESILNRDYPAIQGIVFFTASIVVLLNLVVDIAYAYIDPRIRYR